MTVIDDGTLLEKNVVVSRRSQVDDIRPAYVYREAPSGELDSGWRAMVGDETDAEIGDPANLLREPVAVLLARWPELRDVLGADPATGDWAWDGFDETYVSIAD